MTIISLILTYRYWILFPVACIEGPVISLVVGFLIYLGELKFVPSFIILIFGDLIPDLIYFYIGRIGNSKKLIEKYSPKLKVVSASFFVIEKLWQDHPKKTMFFSKLAYGLSIPFLISAGLVKMPLKKFVCYAVPVSIFQYGILMGLGYFLGKSYELAINYVKDGYVIIAFLLVTIIVAYFFSARYSRDQIKKMEASEK